MNKPRTAQLAKIILIVVVLFLLVSGAGVYRGCRYINEKLLQSNLNMAVDMALLIGNNFEITDAEVTYMKSLTFDEMETDQINARLMKIGTGMNLSTNVINIYILAPLQREEIKYEIDEESADFFGYEVGTPLDGIWLLNGTMDENGIFQVEQREDIYRYTSLSPVQRVQMEKEQAFGELSVDEWGYFVTGYVPVYTVEGNFVGMLGIDIDPNQYQNSARNMVFIVITAFIISLAVMTALFLIFYGKYVGTNEAKYKEKEKRYCNQLDAMFKVDDENLIAKGQHNLSQNSTAFYYGKQRMALPITEKYSYEEAVNCMAALAVKWEMGEEIRSKMNRERLLSDFKQGKVEGSVEYQRKTADKNQNWTLMKYAIYEEPIKHEIMLFIYSYDITTRVINRRIVARLGSMDCDMMGLLDAKTHQYELKNISRKQEQPEVPGKGDFDECVKSRLYAIALPSERDRVMRRFQVENIVEQLENKEDYYIVYSIVDDKKQIRRKRCRFCYLDDTRTLILYCRADITDMYQKEQEQLKQTEDALTEAKKASEAKTEFFARMSHDLRTPMNGILGLAELSEDESDMAILRQNISKIRSSGKYMLGLINDTLDFQKIESGRMNLDNQIVNAQELLDSIASMIAETAKEKGVQFDVVNKNVELNWYVRLDAMRVKQIVVNLLSNAVKFTPAGGTVELCIECTERKGMSSHMQIVITDTGIGMGKEFLQNGIFKPFSQESNVVTSNNAGTGLGLSIAKKLVDLMGGTIAVESEQGIGTVFTVDIDFECVNSSDVMQQKNADVTRKHNIVEILEGRKVLLAEDHLLNAEIAERLLKKAGCLVSWVKNGQECVDAFCTSAKDQYDIIMMDIRMPVMDGLTAARTIRGLNREDAAEVPILAMTANAYDEDIRRSLAAGMNGHISKPIDPAVMYKSMADAITACNL